MPLASVYPDRFRKRVQDECRKLGIDFVFEDYLDDAVIKEGVVTTRKGKRLVSDLVVSTVQFPADVGVPTSNPRLLHMVATLIPPSSKPLAMAY